MEGVSERYGAGVEERATFFFEHLGDHVGRVDRQGAIIPMVVMCMREKGGRKRTHHEEKDALRSCLASRPQRS